MNNKIHSKFKRTTIVCTLGPATDSDDVMRGMIRSGMNVARLNLSHGVLDDQLRRLDLVRRIAVEEGEFVACMFDTRGPDIRIGEIGPGEVEMVEGDEITLDLDSATGSRERVGVSFPGMFILLSLGDVIFINDGLVELRVVGCSGEWAKCRVITGGTLSSRKGINIPGKIIPLPVLTDEDIHDLREGVKHGIEFISASFVNTAEDIHFIRDAVGNGDVGIIAKVESAAGVQNLNEIVNAADGVMVARGDLGVEIPPEQVPGVQKRMIKLCREAGKPVITATEMLESMIKSSRPTRAEITDVANAVLDGTTAVMLSAETAVGKYPVQVVEIMSRICRQAEIDLPTVPERLPVSYHLEKVDLVRGGIAHAACELANDIKAAAIICVTDSGATAAIFSNLRPRQPVLACTPDEKVARKLAMYWGVLPVVVDAQENVEKLLKNGVEVGKSRGFIETGDRIVFTGNLSGKGGDTNLLATVEVK